MFTKKISLCFSFLQLCIIIYTFAKKNLKIHYFEECFRETLTFSSSSGLTYHDLQSCYQKRMSFATLLLDFSKTSLSWQTSKVLFKRYTSMLLFQAFFLFGYRSFFLQRSSLFFFRYSSR